VKFRKLDNIMRKYETASDQKIPPEFPVVLRLDGHAFHTLTNNNNFKKPFDDRIRDYMVDTARHLVEHSPLKIRYAYTQSDEISLLIDPFETSFNRKIRKILSNTSAYASAKFTKVSGLMGAFDNRYMIYPTREVYITYFRWRQSDSERNSLNTWVHYTLINQGFTASQATRKAKNMKKGDKHDLLFKYDINYNDLPLWQKRGIGIYWEKYQKNGFNPKTGENVTVDRKRIKVDYELPTGEDYSVFLEKVIYDSVPGEK
jgi:tRNA(His) 5'-end guanylyltransferase